jgi:Holliday junction resolvase RusA-like endonuclease
MIKIILPVPPTANTRLKFSHQGHYYTPKAVKTYQAKVRQIVMEEAIKPYENDVAVHLTWYRARKSGDLPERFKDLYDALEAKRNHGFGPYFNDKQIAEEHKRRDDTDKDNPRVEVIFYEINDKD